MSKTKQFSIPIGLALAVVVTGLSAQAQPVTVIKTGVVENGENICFGFAGGKFSGAFIASECSYFASIPESGLTYENQRIRSVNAPGVTLVPGVGGRLQFRTGDSPDRAFLFDDNYLSELGWRAMHPDNAAWGRSCMQVQKDGISFKLVVHVDPGANTGTVFPFCTQLNIPENQVWLETLQPPKTMFLKFDYAIQGNWPNTTPVLPGTDLSTLPRLCAGFDNSTRTWLFDRCDKLSADRRDTILRYGDDQTVRNGAGECLTRLTTVNTEVQFEACAPGNDYQRFAFVDQHEGKALWPALVAAAGTVDGSTVLSGAARQVLPATNKPSAACLFANPFTAKMYLGHCETYLYNNERRTLRAANRTVTMLEVQVP
jgi:hypothetical protein